MCKQNLSRQLIAIVIIIFGIIFLSLGLLVPKILLPIYENNIYNYLKQPLEFINSEVDDKEFNSDIAYLYVTNDGLIITSTNIKNIIKLNPEKIIKNILEKQGKFHYLGNTYYYYTDRETYVTKIALTNNNYINKIKSDILRKIFPALLLTFILVVGLVLLWSRQLIKKIEHLKEKIDNLDNDNYVDKYKYNVDDELKSLSISIDNMKKALKEQEKYKNQMYQNISHDFKTPITVMKSYIEASEDGIETKEKTLEIIKEQLNKLEIKVHSLLYLNKLNYIKEQKENLNEVVEVDEIIDKSIEKFKVVRPDIEFSVSYDKKHHTFRGSSDMWEAIIDNILGNFVRYARKSIKVTIKNNKITLYNDGPNIDENIINNIFTPYEKGVKGVFGLGLSIVQKTLSLLNYEIIIENQKKGVMFTIRWLKKKS